MKDPHLPDTPTFSNKIRVPGADEPKNALEVLKIQFENFRKWKLNKKKVINLNYKMKKKPYNLIAGKKI